MGWQSERDDSRTLDVVTEALRCAGPEFPDITLSDTLRHVFSAEFAGAGDVDFLGTSSRRWADSPGPIAMRTRGFHEFAIHNPVTEVYRHAATLEPVRLSDVVSPHECRALSAEFGMSRLLVIPLALSHSHLAVMVLMRSGRDFPPRAVRMARRLQPILGGIYTVWNRTPVSGVPPPPEPCTRLTPREFGVLELMADGLIAVAIAGRLGISPRTVGKHIENIYRKLDTHDRTSAVLRAQSYGILVPPSPAASKVTPARDHR